MDALKLLSLGCCILNGFSLHVTGKHPERYLKSRWNERKSRNTSSDLPDTKNKSLYDPDPQYLIPTDSDDPSEADGYNSDDSMRKRGQLTPDLPIEWQNLPTIERRDLNKQTLWRRHKRKFYALLLFCMLIMLAGITYAFLAGANVFHINL